MPIDHKRKLIFVHIPKTGGTSVDMLLTHNAGKKMAGEVWDLWGTPKPEHLEALGPKRPIDPSSGHRAKLLHHFSATHIKSIVEREVWNSYIKFSIVRNPWDRIVSYFEYGLQTGGRIGTEGKTFKQWFYERDVIPTCTPYLLEHEENLGMNKIIRFENLVQDFSELCTMAAIPFVSSDFPHYKKTVRRHYSEYYDDDMVAMVEHAAAVDIKLMKYKFEKL